MSASSTQKATALAIMSIPVACTLTVPGGAFRLQVFSQKSLLPLAMMLSKTNLSKQMTNTKSERFQKDGLSLTFHKLE